jgi:hypothetical protein
MSLRPTSLSASFCLIASFAAAVTLSACSPTPAPRTRTESPLVDCGEEGTAHSLEGRALNRLKNRSAEPRPDEINHTITLGNILERGVDEERWKNATAVEITGYVARVHAGGRETCNCDSAGLRFRDTHIVLALDPQHARPTETMIVEVTPRWRERMRREGVNWSTPALRKLKGRWIKVTGWLMFDTEHWGEAVNTGNLSHARKWRRTAWEVHPVTSIVLLPEA